MKKLNAYQKIQLGIKQNEKDVIKHIKKYGPIEFSRCGLSWMKAIERLRDAGKVQYSEEVSRYVLR